MVTASIKFAGNHLYTWVERGTVLPKNTTQCPWLGLELGPLDPETSALTMETTAPPTSTFVYLNQTYVHFLYSSSFTDNVLAFVFIILVPSQLSRNEIREQIT